MREKLAEWLKGHQTAIELILTVHEIAETWDDLIDEDSVPDEQVNKAFYAALITLPRNPFYRENFSLLNPIMESAIFDWWTANEFEEARDPQKLHAAYMLKCGLHNTIILCARIVGGVDHAAKVNIEMRSLGETWEQYAGEFGVK